MSCNPLLKGLNLSCDEIGTRYYQNVVLVNLKDVSTFNIETLGQKNRVSFNLDIGTTGYRFSSNERVELIGANFNKTRVKNVDYYDHRINMPIAGTSEYIKTLLRELDGGEYFGAVHHVDGVVEIFGFEYGLQTNGYDYNAQGGIGGANLILSSTYTERYPPFVYLPKSTQPNVTQQEQAIIDFDNLFADIPSPLTGDFNNDFSDDFYITG